MSLRGEPARRDGCGRGKGGVGAVKRARRLPALALAAGVVGVVGLGAEAAPQVTLHYFTWAGGAAADWIREDWIEPFEATHPNIKIQYEAVGFNEFWDKLATYIATGNAPDVIHMSVAYVYDYAKAGWLLNLEPYFKRDLRASDFFMEPAKAVRYPDMERGDLYAIPFGFVATALFYNKDLFNRAGVGYPDASWTWDQVRVAAKKLTLDTTGDGQPDQWGFWSRPSYWVVDPIIHAFGGATLSKDYQQVLLDRPESIAALKFLRDMIWEDRSAPPPSLWKGDLFQDGKVAMYVSTIASLDAYRRIAAFDWDVALMPAGPARRVVRLWPDSFAIPTGSRHPEEAWAFIKSAITRKKMDRYNGSRKIPFLRALALSPEWLEKDQKPNKAVFIESAQYGDPLEFRPRWGEWQGPREAELMKAWRNEVPIEFAAKAAAQVIRNALSRP